MKPHFSFSKGIVLYHVWPLLPQHVNVAIGNQNEYNPFTNTVTFTEYVFSSQTTASVAIAAHELAHCSQNFKRFYVTQFTMAGLALILAVAMPFKTALLVAAIYFVVAKMHRLALEADASLVALRFIKKRHRFNTKIAKLVLWRAFITYLNPFYFL